MKKYSLFSALLIAICCFACEDSLRVTPENSVTFANAFENEHELENGFATVESYVREIAMGQIAPMKNGEYADAFNSKNDAALLNESSPGQYLSQWLGFYNAIAMANVVLPYTDRVDMPQERRDFYKGQVYFTKAFLYLELGRRWGRCPIIRDKVELDPVVYSPWVEVIDYAIEMARMAVELLPEFTEAVDYQGNAIQYKSTPSKGAARAVLAHLCAWKAGCKYLAQPEEANYDENALWREADSVCTALINSGVYELADSPEKVCTEVMRGNSKEGIYESILRGYFTSELSDAVSAHVFGWYYESWPIVPGAGENRITRKQKQIKVETVRRMYPTRMENGVEVVDLRRDAYFYKLDSMAHDTLLGVTGGNAYPQKWRDVAVQTSGWNEGEFINFDANRVWFRLADVILLRAECRARLGNSEGAIKDLNTIRERAHAKLYDALEYGGDLRYAIFKEREKELLMEGTRWFDVVRNEYYKTELYGGFQKVSPQDILDGVFFNGVYPDAFANNPLARQNTYWMKRM